MSKLFRFVGLVLTLALVLSSFVGCGGKATKEDSSTVAASGTAGDTGSDGAASGEPIKIGVSVAITGPVPMEGERSKQGVLMAVEEINAAGGVLGRPLEIVVEDDQNTANMAVNVANKLVSDPDIVAIVGPHRSGNVMAVEKIMQDAGMPFLTGGSSPNLVTQIDNEYLFRIRASDDFVGKVIAKYALEEVKAERIGIIFNNDDSGSGGKNVVVDYLKNQGVEPAVVEGHNTDDKDMSGAITKLKNANVDAIIVYTHDPEAAIFTRQRHEMGLSDVPIVGPTTFTLPTYLSLTTADETQNIFSVADFVPGNPDPLVQKFETSFREKFDVEPDLFASYYYTGVYVLKDAIERAGTADRESIKNAILETKDLPSVYGTLYSNEDGELVHSAMIAEIVDHAPIYSTTIEE